MKIKITEEEYREALEIWLSKNPGKTVNDVSNTAIVTISNGKEIKLGAKLSLLVQAAKGQNTSKISESQNAYWFVEKGLTTEDKNQRGRIIHETKCREALEIWLSENPGKTVNDILKATIVTISTGEKIKIGLKISNLRLALKGVGSCKISEDQNAYWVERHKLTAFKKNPEQQTLKAKYLERFNGNEEKTRIVMQTLKNISEKIKNKKKKDWTIDSILQEFNMDIEKLMNCFNKTKTTSTKSPILEYQGKTLKKFCTENSFNYNVIKRAIKLHEIGIKDNLEELIDRERIEYQKNGQKEPATWIYEKYDYRIKHILLYLNLDVSSILREMNNYQITLEEAIRHEVFKNSKEQEENSWLEEAYEYLIEEVQVDKSQGQITNDVANMFVYLVKEYYLTEDETRILWNSFSKYVKTIKEYQLVSVGLETNEQRKLDKIKKYKLDLYDIETSFFIPLEFDKNVLLGRKSELYMRRQLLRQYIIDWDSYTEDEKQQIIIKHQFKEEEIEKINTTRKELNDTIIKIKKR